MAENVKSFFIKKYNKKRGSNYYLFISREILHPGLPPTRCPQGAESCDPGARSNGAESWDLFFFFFLIILPHYILIIHPFASKSQVFFAKKIKKFFYHMQVPFVKSKIKKIKKDKALALPLVLCNQFCCSLFTLAAPNEQTYHHLCFWLGQPQATPFIL